MLSRIAAVFFISTMFAMSPENQNGAALVVRVVPEMHLDIHFVQRSFIVTNPGLLELSDAVTVMAWVRALPGQEIRLMAPLVLNGPSRPGTFRRYPVEGIYGECERRGRRGVVREWHF